LVNDASVLELESGLAVGEVLALLGASARGMLRVF